MVIGVPREIKAGEQRVAVTPAGVHALAERGHRVLVEKTAGTGSGFRDDDFSSVGAELGDAGRVWSEADLVLKVKEPLPLEYERLRRGQVLFTYLHLAPAPELTQALVQSGAIAIAYETVQTDDGALLYVTYGGVLDVQPEVMGRIFSGQDVDISEYYFRTTPRIETGAEQHAWLNKVVCVGVGKAAPGKVAYRVFAIR